MGKLKKILLNLDQILMAAAMAVVCILLMVQVFFRYVLNSPLIWSEECARYTFVWIVMLGLGYNVRTGNNISVSLLTSHLPKTAQKVLDFVTDLVVAGVYICCLPPILQYLSMQSRIKSTAMRMPMGLLAVSVLIGVASMILQLLLKAVRTAKSIRAEKSMKADKSIRMAESSRTAEEVQEADHGKGGDPS